MGKLFVGIIEVHIDFFQNNAMIIYYDNIKIKNLLRSLIGVVIIIIIIIIK